MFRRDEAGFPDFEDIDSPPSSFGWNQQSDEQYIEWEVWTDPIIRIVFVDVSNICVLFNDIVLLEMSTN